MDERMEMVSGIVAHNERMTCGEYGVDVRGEVGVLYQKCIQESSRPEVFHLGTNIYRKLNGQNRRASRKRMAKEQIGDEAHCSSGP